MTVTAGKGEIQQGGNFQSVLKKHLVEIAKAEKKHIPLVIPFYPPVLIEHRAWRIFTAGQVLGRADSKSLLGYLFALSSKF
jgi:hypothetical protein